MDKKTKPGPKIAEIATQIFALLGPLSSEDRQRVVSASLTLLGEKPAFAVPAPPAPPAGEGGKPEQGLAALPPKAATWAKQNGLVMAQLEQVFDITGAGVSIIASKVPGKNDKEKTHNAYVLEGLSRLLATGDATIEDKAARSTCEALGCYNSGKVPPGLTH